MRAKFGQSELEAAQKDPLALEKLVLESEGYVLERMRRLGLMPELEVLMARPNAYALGFILDHYDLGPAEVKILEPMFKKTIAGEKRVSQQAACPAQYALENKVALRKGTVLSKAQLNAYVEEIGWQFELDEEDTAEILEASVAGFTAEEFLSLDPKFIEDNAFLMSDALSGEFEKSELFRQKYRELMEKRAAGSRRGLDWRSFRRWPFRSGDKPFLEKILEQAGSFKPDWEEFSELKGASGLIGPMEYFEKWNGKELSGIPADEIRAQKVRVASCLMDRFSAQGRAGLDDLLSLRASQEQFEAFADEDFAQEWLKRGYRADFSCMWRDDPESLQKAQRLRRVFVGAAIREAKAGRRLLDPAHAGQLLRELLSRNKGFGGEPEDLALGKQAVSALLPGYLKTLDGLDRLDYCVEAWFEGLGTEAIGELAQTAPTPNLLHFVLQMWARGQNPKSSQESKRIAESLEPVCSRLAASVARPSAKALCGLWGFKMPLSQALGLGKGAPEAQAADDYLKLDYADFGQWPEKVKAWVCEADGAFAQKMAKAGAWPSEGLMIHMLARSESNPRMKRLCMEYVRKDPQRAEAMEKFYAQAKRSALGPELFDLAAESDPKRAYGEFEAAAKRLFEAGELYGEKKAQLKAAGFSDDFWGGRQKQRPAHIEELLAQREIASKEQSQAQTELAALVSKAPAAAVRGWVRLAARGKSWAALWAAKEHARDAGAREELAALANKMGLAEFEQALAGSREFRSCIEKLAEEDGSGLSLDFGDAQSNGRAAGLLCLGRSEEGKKGYRRLAAFSKKALAGFANEFLIGHFPQQAVYEYDLRPKEIGEDYSGLVPKRYTKEQLWRLWGKLSEGPGYFCSKDVNARPGEFFYAQFSGDEQGYLEWIEESKKDPLLHLVSINRHLTDRFCKQQEGLPWDDLRNNRDKLHMDYVWERFDLDIAIEGVRALFAQMRAKDGRDQDYCPKLALQALDTLAWSTYYDYRDQTGQTRYASRFSQEQSQRLLDVLMENSPLYVYGLHALGCFEPVCKRVAETMERYNGRGDLAERLLYPDTAGMRDNFSLERRFKDYAKEILAGLLKWMMSQGDPEDLEALAFAVRQRDFLEKELTWEAVSEAREKSGAAQKCSDFLDLLATDEDLSPLLRAATEKASLGEHAADYGARRKKAGCRL